VWLVNATRLVVLLVGSLALVALLGIIALAFRAQPIPDVLQNVAVGSLTGLVGPRVPPRPGSGT
jgi:hypothetical protein